MAYPEEYENAARLATLRARFRGCLLGGAVGDALGGPVEFLRL
ncbi:MAG: ADP-ribosylglycohydrolase family protein, partial [Cronobacter sakazakii]|nr:ADP-ribosylglycohydrolase family protein [Cronobacter sakazakii]